MAIACRAPVQRLRDWVARGTVRPLAPGGRGRGNGHLLSVQQAIGVAVACWALDGPRGCRAAYLAGIVAHYASWPWSEVERCLGLSANAAGRVVPGPLGTAALGIVVLDGDAPAGAPVPAPGSSDPVKILPLFCSLLGLRDAVSAKLRRTTVRKSGARTELVRMR